MGCLQTFSPRVKAGIKRISSIFSTRKASTDNPLTTEKTNSTESLLPEYSVVHTKKLQKQKVSKAEVASNPVGSLRINLQNQTTSNDVFVYVTGRAIDKDNGLFILGSDAKTPYYPTSPAGTMQPLGAECAIKLGAPGSTTEAQIPHIAGGRVWFSTGQPMTFLLNPGPSLVEPSVANDSDVNNKLNWGFAELTWNKDQLYANISYVDFVGIPAALTLETLSNKTLHVSGMKPEGLQQIADGLRQQHDKDKQGWDQLIVNQPGDSNKVLRVLSPGQAMAKHDKLFDRYYDNYVDQVFQKFTTASLSVDTQMKSGVVSAQVKNDVLTFNGSTFKRPTTLDIFSCDTGPFQTGSDPQTNAIIPRLAAEFNRSTLLTGDKFPAPRDGYYKTDVTNHYSRIVHAANLDNKGYAFPYDDVQPTDGGDQSGEVHAGDPKALTIAIGGGNAHTA